MGAQPSVPVGRAAYQLGEGWIPYPPSLGPLLRADHAEAHWAGVLATIFHADRMRRYRKAQLAVARALRARLERRLRDDGPPDAPGGPKTSTVAYVTYLVPTVPCASCGRPLLRDSDRRRHCSERCRVRASDRRRHRRVRDAAAGTGTPTGALCLHCGGAVTAAGRAYCSDRCQRHEQERRRRERRLAGALAAAPSPPKPCPICGGPVTGRNERAVYCGKRCKWRAQKRRSQPERPPCRSCGATVPPGWHLFCTPACRQLARIRVRRERAALHRPPPAPCLACGGPMTGRRADAVYCSLRCRDRVAKRRVAARRQAVAR